MKEFRDRVAVVTGAASGIGFALAERCAAEKMKVVLADVEERALARAEAELKAKGATTLAVRTDVSKPDDVERLATNTLSAFGAVHALFNNAGVGGDFSNVWEISLQGWQWVLGVNLWGVIYGIRTFVPIMLRQGSEAHVVNTASMAGHVPGPMLSPYHASKFAVVTISESLYYELAMAGAPVKVSVLCPGFVKTRILEDQRNRPAELQRPNQPVSEAAQMYRNAFEQFVGAGVSPAQVAEAVLEAIREERFYVFPNPEFLPFVKLRMDAIVEQRNPALQLPPEMEATLKV